MKLKDFLVRENLVLSEKESSALILAGYVLVNGSPCYHVGYSVKKDDEIILKARKRFVSRSAEKILPLIQKWGVVISDLDWIDIGASTGGFTEVLLHLGARRVASIDVGYGLLHPRLRKDPRVYVMERTNFFRLQKEELPFEPDGYVADISFASLRGVLQKIAMWAEKDTSLICLFKPQFEIAKEERKKLERGILKDEGIRQKTLKEFLCFASGLGWQLIAQEDAPIKGAKGNQEVVIYFKITRASLI
ncbi:MAG: TlyA family RNA methyltransferase [Leptospiraceae bacterium]|nr:TlyA family RNA methyltransferase [Leptospiraceae bacterium]MDW8307102.1 TlyA family RNA methyltransferase [Leptospiraceae bacterium]